MTKEELIKTLEKYDIEVNKLFQENKKLKDPSNYYQYASKLVKNNCESLQQRIDKAIEYINKRTFEEEVMFEYEVRELLKILKGEENDKN
jgi:hypothetical protein